jgi:cytochrome P450
MPPQAPPPVMHGTAAARWYVRFFRDPVGTLIEGQRRFGRLFALGGVLPRRKRYKLHAVALGAAYNRIVFGDPALFHSTGQSLCGPKDSALRRIRHGLTRMNGTKHKQARRLIMPLFAKKAIDGYHECMAEIADQHVASWPAGVVVNAWKLVRALALDVSSQLLFGREDPARATALGELMGEWLRRNFSAGVWLFPVNLPGTPYRGLLKHSERIEGTVLAMMAERRAKASAGIDILSALVRAHDAEAEADSGADFELVGQANILFAASFETVATSLTWMLFLLAQHPAIASDLLDELSPLDGAAPDSHQLDDFVYLDAVVREALRLLPPVPFAIRSPAADLDLDGLPLRRGDRLIVSHYITHHDPELYPDPEIFDPTRWFTIRPTAYEYLPFSAGPRMCSGYAFALTELKIVLALALQRWRPAVVPGARIDRTVRITMAPKYGLPIVLYPQDGRFTAVPVRGDIHDMVDLSGATERRIIKYPINTKRAA